MNKKFTYLILLAVFFCFTAFVVVRYNAGKKNPEYFTLKDRQGPSALLPEWAVTKKRGDDLYRQVTARPDDINATLQLAGLYIQEARVTGNYSYYDAAAMKYIDDVLAQKPQNFDALVLKAVLQLSQHHFSDALGTAAIAQKINPYNSFIYGIMVDGNVEMGDYKKAVENSDQMMSVRPDIRSYARVSYLREIYGDYPGAIEAMKLAVGAGAYGDEGTEWARIQLGRLYENTGDKLAAAMHYTIALNERPGFGYALAGLGHVAMADKDYGKAISLYQKADSAISDYAVKEQLAELYQITGQKAKADAAINAIIDELTKASQQGEQSINHHADKELAYVYLLKNDPDNAIKHALAEYSRRPDNIDVNEAVAWAYYKKGDISSALPYIDRALVTHSQNPALLCHAAAIHAKAGKKDQAKTELQLALKNNPDIDPVLKQQSLDLQKTL